MVFGIHRLLIRLLRIFSLLCSFLRFFCLTVCLQSLLMTLLLLGLLLSPLIGLQGPSIKLDCTTIGLLLPSRFRLTGLSYQGVLGLLLIVLGFQTFTFAILLQMLARRGASRRP